MGFYELLLGSKTQLAL